MSPRIWIFCGAVLGALGVGLGAYHAHGLQKMLDQRGLIPDEVQRQMQNFDVGVRYEIYHALALILVGLLASPKPSAWFHTAGGLFLAGTLLFCGALFIPVLADVKLSWIIVPTGGAALILGWVTLAIAALRA